MFTRQSISRLIFIILVIISISISISYTNDDTSDNKKQNDEKVYKQSDIAGYWQTELNGIGMGQVLFIFKDDRYQIFMYDEQNGIDMDFPFDEGKFWFDKDYICMVSLEYNEKKYSESDVKRHQVLSLTENHMEWLSEYYASNKDNKNEKEGEEKKNEVKIIFQKHKGDQD